MNEQQFVQISRLPRVAQPEFTEFSREFEARKWSRLMPPQFPPETLSEKIANNVVTPADAPIPDCQTCGVCCNFFLFVGVSTKDVVSPVDYMEITMANARGEFVIDRFMRHDPETLHCSALGGALGENVSCRVYYERPFPCRAFEAGSDKCHALRRVYGLEPFLSLDEMSQASDRLDALEAQSDPAQTVLDVQIRNASDEENFVIAAILADGSHEILHVYDPRDELWLESEVFARSLEKVRRLVETRRATGAQKILVKN